jgi:hypothetical protein
MSSSDEMYKLGVRDAEQDDLNLFYYQHYYYYRQGYDQSRRATHGVVGTYRAWVKRLFPLVSAFLVVAVIVGAGWFVLRLFGGDRSTASNGEPGSSVVAVLPDDDTGANGETGDNEQSPTSPSDTTDNDTTSLEPSAPRTAVAVVPATTIQVGGLVQVVNVGNSPLRARSSPGLDHPIETSFAENVQVEILSGPVEADGYIWWELQGDEGIGWCAESSPDGLQWLQPVQVAVQPTRTTVANTEPTNTPTPIATPTPAPPTPTPTPSEPYMHIGGMARIVNVGGTELTGRNEPGLEATYQIGFPEGSEVKIVDGPVRVDDYIWWLLESDAGSGWSAEGSPDGDMWLEPFFPLSEEDLAKTAAALETATAEEVAKAEAATATMEAEAQAATATIEADMALLAAQAETDTAEIEATQVALEKSATATPTPTPTPEVRPLHVGGIAVVSNVGGAKLSGRDEPGLDESNVVVQFLDGEEVVVLLGPIEADGYTWWRIEGDSGVGWSAEKDPEEGTIWITPQ